ncbi:SDR family NAD(P)-dependent oxidoreductase [Nereida sp. MMG025]|uniref:SDR family NAD(P)-dependent oxidoreductase n=1 Tax=Nereida sp. MMG025 TaxID=2909981 RepID=UPI001F443E32|nr:SDR family NAD(P)-dependent oxidoreductase [Nereida sp. MMG025]MCF6443518.1 SDR family NAD(P)-dependent oxidoreductase [Nereida sp. MMG025]
MNIKGASCIVTGGASGLGLATAKGFLAAGAEVLLLDLDPKGAQVAAQIGARFAQTDVTDDASVQTALADLEKLDVAVNCAGIATGEKTVGRDGAHQLASFRRTVDINLVGSFNVARLAAAKMAQNDGPMRGVVINTASIAAFDGQKGQTAYAASKAGIAGLSLPMARDLASLGIRVMAIAPGIFRTPMLEGLGEDIMDDLAADVTFPKRLGDPAEFARLAQFIIECDYLNGEVIRLDGALRMP